MKTFKIEVQEFLSRIIEIKAKAENVDEAISKIKKMYQSEKIILDSDDYVKTEINELSK